MMTCPQESPVTHKSLEAAVQDLANHLREATTNSSTQDSTFDILNKVKQDPIVYSTTTLQSFGDDNNHDNQHQHQQQPTPPPPIAFLPDQTKANPHMLTAFILQALFLGASALGLLVRKRVKHSNLPESTADTSILANEHPFERFTTSLTTQPPGVNTEPLETTSRSNDDDEQVQALNLLLMSHVVEQTSDLNKTNHPTNQHVKSFMSVIRKFVDQNLTPNEWTSTALLAFAQPHSSTLETCHSIEQDSTFHQVRSTLVRQAWQILLNTQWYLNQSWSSTNHGQTLIESFIQASHDLPIETKSSLINNLQYHFNDMTKDTKLKFVKMAIKSKGYHVVQQLLKSTTAMASQDKIVIVDEMLIALTNDIEWQRDRTLVVDLVDQFCSSLIESVNMLSTQDKNLIQVRVINVVKKILDNLLGIDIAFEGKLTTTIVQVLNIDSLFFSIDFTKYFIKKLIEKNNVKHAYQVLEILIQKQNQLDKKNLNLNERVRIVDKRHFELMLTSQDSKVSDLIWYKLTNRHSNLIKSFGQPTIETLGYRLRGLVRQEKLSRRRDALRQARHSIHHIKQVWPLVDLDDTTRFVVNPSNSSLLWSVQWRNDLLKLASHHGRFDDSVKQVLQEFEECSKRTNGKVKPDDATRAIVLGKNSRHKMTTSQKLKGQVEQVVEGYKTLIETVPDKDVHGQDSASSSMSLSSSSNQLKVETGLTGTIGLEVARNVVLRTITRSFQHCDIRKVVELCLSELDVDLSSDKVVEEHLIKTCQKDDENDKIHHRRRRHRRHNVVVMFDRVREPRYKMFLKALRNRGCQRHLFHSRLLQVYRAEQLWVQREYRGTKG
ncbi:hypothetical protein OIO90_003339 [Microbotryomycetes sp. JL221]|nr:hypothetical protein OIO90_003339 [Microbotryomycetes sp. JL221]